MKRTQTKSGRRYEVMASGLIRLPSKAMQRVRQDQQDMAVWPPTKQQKQEMRAKFLAEDAANDAEVRRKFEELRKRFDRPRPADNGGPY